MEHTTEEHLPNSLVATFLADMANAIHSSQTCRVYAADLTQDCAFHQGSMQMITTQVLRTLFEMHTDLRLQPDYANRQK